MLSYNIEEELSDNLFWFLVLPNSLQLILKRLSEANEQFILCCFCCICVFHKRSVDLCFVHDFPDESSLEEEHTHTFLIKQFKNSNNLPYLHWNWDLFSFIAVFYVTDKIVLFVFHISLDLLDEQQQQMWIKVKSDLKKYFAFAYFFILFVFLFFHFIFKLIIFITLHMIMIIMIFIIILIFLMISISIRINFMVPFSMFSIL